VFLWTDHPTETTLRIEVGEEREIGREELTKTNQQPNPSIDEISLLEAAKSN